MNNIEIWSIVRELDLGKMKVETADNKLNNLLDNLKADIRNKMTPLKNLVSLLENSKVSLHQSESVHKLIIEELENCKRCLNYIDNL